MESLVQALVLGLVILPLVRLSASTGFRRRLGALHAVAITLVLLVTVYLVSLIVLLILAPLVLRYVFLGACGVFLVLVVRAHPAYGCARGLPPGSLALLPVGPWVDPDYYAKQAARYGPIFKVSDLYRPCVCLIGIAPARELFSQYADALRVPAFPFNRFIPNGFLRFTDSARHRAYRSMFQQAFAPAILRTAEPFIRETIHSGLEQMGRASIESSNGVHPKAYIEQIVLVVLVRLFFGIVPETDSLRQFEQLLHVVALRRAARTSDAAVKQALSEMLSLIQITVSRSPETCSFVAELARANPAGWDEQSILLNLVYMFQVGYADLSGLLHWLCKMLSDYPAWAMQVRTEIQGNDLATRIVFETLRLQQSEFLIRQTTREIQFKNFVIPRGWFVRMCIKESHHASAAFESPKSFNPDRFLARRYTRAEFMPFGAFDKTCLGEHLTLSVGRTFVLELARRFEWHVVQDGPQEFSGFHWQPSSKFRISIQQVAL